MNILDKTNRSQAPVFGSTEHQVPKREKFSWAQPSDPGVFLMVKKQDLNIDGAYQRDAVSETKVREIASGWDWRLFGTLSVILRPDQTLWVYDGGHRCRASFLRDDITELPCMVFEADSIIDEAKAFLGTNMLKTFVSAYHKHKAGVLSGEPLSQATQAIIEKHGYTTGSTNRKTDFAAINTLRQLVQENAELADRAFGACAEIASKHGDEIPGEVLKALFRCQSKLGDRVNIFAGELFEKLCRESMPGIDSAIRREKAIVGKGGAVVGAKAVLDLLNKGKHRKIHWT